MTPPEPIEAMRYLREALAGIAHRYPHLVHPARGTAADVASWERTLGDDVGETKQTAFRLPADLIDRLDKRAAKFTRRTGIETSRADLVRAYLEMGLELTDLVERDPALSADLPVIRDLVAFALDGLAEARRRASDKPDGT